MTDIEQTVIIRLIVVGMCAIAAILWFLISTVITLKERQRTSKKRIEAIVKILRKVLKPAMTAVLSAAFIYGFALLVSQDANSRIRSGCWHRFGTWEENAGWDQVKTCEKCNIAILRSK